MEYIKLIAIAPPINIRGTKHRSFAANFLVLFILFDNIVIKKAGNKIKSARNKYIPVTNENLLMNETEYFETTYESS